jgi:hypothetical protein
MSSLFGKKSAVVVTSTFVALSLASAFCMLPVFGIWVTPVTGITESVDKIMNEKYGSAAVAQEIGMIGANDLTFYMMLKDPNLNYSALWPNQANKADYIVSPQGVTIATPSQ